MDKTREQDAFEFIKSHIDLIDSNTKESWQKIYMDLEEYDGENLPGDLGYILLTCGIDPSETIGEIPRRFLQYQDQVSNYRIPDNCTFIGMSAFEDTSISYIDIPEKVTELDYCCFCGSKIKRIILPDSVERLQGAVFFQCRDLQEADLGNVKYMYEETFYGCSNLKHLILPNTIASIHFSNFSGCSSLKEIVYKGTIEQFIKAKHGQPDQTIQVHCTDGDYTWQKTEFDWD